MGLRFTLSQRIRFHGMVAGERKSALLRQSSGLIFPVVWHEPFGLAVVESLYMGAPVFATPYGALPEIVTPAITAFTSSSVKSHDVILYLLKSHKFKNKTPIFLAFICLSGMIFQRLPLDLPAHLRGYVAGRVHA